MHYICAVFKLMQSFVGRDCINLKIKNEAINLICSNYYADKATLAFS